MDVVVYLTTDPRIPTMPPWSTSGFYRPGKHCSHHARSAVRCLASLMKGEMHRTKNCAFEADFLAYEMPASTFFSGVATSRDSNGGVM